MICILKLKNKIKIHKWVLGYLEEDQTITLNLNKIIPKKNQFLCQNKQFLYRNLLKKNTKKGI